MRTILCALSLMCEPAYSSELTVAAGGITVHGGDINPELAKQMPHRLREDGREVYHPVEFSVRSRGEHKQVYGSYLQDCFGESATIFGAGWLTDFGDWSPGVVGAIYIRQTHYFIESNGRSALPERMPFTVVDGDREYTPLLLATLSYRFNLLGHPFEWLVGTNYILTHSQVGITFDI